MAETHLVVLGRGGVGKTSLILQFIHGRIDPTTDLPCPDSYRHQVEMNKEAYLLDIIDTEGGPEYDSMRDGLFYTGQGFLLVYSVTNRDSFFELRYFRDAMLRIKQVPDNRVPIVVVATHCDLEEFRQVSVSEGQYLANSWSCPFVEVSMVSGAGVPDSFFQLLQEIANLHPASCSPNMHARNSLRTQCELQ